MDQRDCEYKVLLSCDWGAKQTCLGLFEEEASAQDEETSVPLCSLGHKSHWPSLLLLASWLVSASNWA